MFCILYLVFWWSTVCSVSGGNILYSFCETFSFHLSWVLISNQLSRNDVAKPMQRRKGEFFCGQNWNPTQLAHLYLCVITIFLCSLCKMVHGKLIRTCLFLPQWTLFKNHFNLCATFVKTNLENWLKLAWFSWWFFWLFFWQSEVNLNWPSCIWEWFRSLGNFHRNVKIWPGIQFW